MSKHCDLQSAHFSTFTGCTPETTNLALLRQPAVGDRRYLTPGRSGSVQGSSVHRGQPASSSANNLVSRGFRVSPLRTSQYPEGLYVCNGHCQPKARARHLHCVSIIRPCLLDVIYFGLQRTLHVFLRPSTLSSSVYNHTSWVKYLSIPHASPIPLALNSAPPPLVSLKSPPWH